MAREGAKKKDLEGVFPRHAPSADLIRNDPLGEVVGALEVPAFADREFARGPQRGGDLLGDLEVPPPAAAPPLHVEGAEGTLVADLTEQSVGDLGVLADEIAPPRVVMAILPAEREHRVELHRQPARLVPPVLEQGLAGLEQFLGQGRVETVDPGQRHDGVAAGAGDRDSVELEVAEAADDRVGGGTCAAPAPGGAFRHAGPLRPEKTAAGEREPTRGASGESLHVSVLEPRTALMVGQGPPYGRSEVGWALAHLQSMTPVSSGAGAGSASGGSALAGIRLHTCSDRAVMVSDGLTPRLALIMDPSMT